MLNGEPNEGLRDGRMRDIKADFAILARRSLHHQRRGVRQLVARHTARHGGRFHRRLDSQWATLHAL
jgi:hypothetical protein